MRLTEMRLAKWEESQLPFLNNFFDKIRKMFYNRIELEDNLYCDFITFNSSGAAGTMHVLSHTLNKVPTGFWVTCSLCGTTYCSGTAWDSSTITLELVGSGKAAGAQPGSGDTVTVLVF